MTSRRPSTRHAGRSASDWSARQALPAIEAELARSDLARAVELARQLPDTATAWGGGTDLDHAWFSVRAFEAATYFGCRSTAFRAERAAGEILARLAPEDEAVERLQFGLATVRSESARLGGSLPCMVRATSHAARLALRTVHRRSDFERYQACWEVVELLAILGARRRAVDLARRMHDFAHTRLGLVDAVESAVLLRLCAADVDGVFSRRIASAPPRIEEVILGSLDAAAAPPASAGDVDALQALAAQASALGRDNWAWRAEQGVQARVFDATGDPARFAAATRELQALATRRGIDYLARAQDLNVAWAGLFGADTDPRAGAAVGDPPAAPMPAVRSIGQARGLYQQTCAARRAGRHELAWSLYGQYLSQCAGWPWREWLAQAEHLHGIGELLVALPRASARRAAYPADCVGLVQGALQQARKSPTPGSVAGIAQALEVTPRRLQQAFKTVGLCSPRRYLQGSTRG